MKGLVIVICIFSFMLGSILFGKVTLAKTTDSLLAQVQEIRDNAPNADIIVKNIREKWNAYKDIIQISATHRRIENVTDLIDELETYIKCESKADKQKAAELLANALEEIKQFEEFSTVNIL